MAEVTVFTAFHIGLGRDVGYLCCRLRISIIVRLQLFITNHSRNEVM